MSFKNNENFAQEEEEENIRLVSEENEENTEENEEVEVNTDINKLINSVMEEEEYAAPITEEEAEEGMRKNESSVVSRFYNLFGKDNKVDEDEDEEEYDEESEEEMRNQEMRTQEMRNQEENDESEELNETDVEELIPEMEENEMEENRQDIIKHKLFKPSIKKYKKARKAIKCSTTAVPKYTHNNPKCDERMIRNMEIYKPVSAKLQDMKKIDKSMPRSIKNVFEETIVDFKKINPKLKKSEKERIQGCFVLNSNNTNKFKTFQESESPYNLSINANDVEFENYSRLF